MTMVDSKATVREAVENILRGEVPRFYASFSSFLGGVDTKYNVFRGGLSNCM